MTAPTHIPNKCTDCGAPLKPLRDGFEYGDEWTCSAGCTGFYLDWTKREMRKAFGTPLTRWLDERHRRAWGHFCKRFGHRPRNSEWLESCKRCCMILEYGDE